MEKSHYQARTSFFRSTRHGGGQIRSNVLKELFNWFYRRRLQRCLLKQHENGESTNEYCIPKDYNDTEPPNQGNIDSEYMDT